MLRPSLLRALLAASLIGAGAHAQVADLPGSPSFRPGERVLFDEDYGGTATGSFPSSMALVSGSAEVTTERGGRFLRVNEDASFDLILSGPLPEAYTIAFDMLVPRGTGHAVEIRPELPGGPGGYAALSRRMQNPVVYCGAIFAGVYGESSDDGSFGRRFDDRLAEALVPCEVEVSTEGVRVHFAGEQAAHAPTVALGRGNRLRLFVPATASRDERALIGAIRVRARDAAGTPVGSDVPADTPPAPSMPGDTPGSTAPPPPGGTPGAGTPPVNRPSIAGASARPQQFQGVRIRYDGISPQAQNVRLVRAEAGGPFTAVSSATHQPTTTPEGLKAGTFADASAQSGVEYTYAVAADYPPAPSGGGEVHSDPVRVWLPPTPALETVSVTAQGATLQWLPFPAGTVYELWVQPGISSDRVACAAPSGTTCTYTGTRYGSSYFWLVARIDGRYVYTSERLQTNY